MSDLKPDINDLVRGKTIDYVEQCHDGGTLYEISFHFTDGTQLGLLHTLKPPVPEAIFTPADAEDYEMVEAEIPQLDPARRVRQAIS